MLPSSPITFGQIFLKSLQEYFSVFIKILLFILILAIVKNIPLYLGGLPQAKWLRYPLEILLAAVIGYVIFVSIYVTNKILLGKTISFSQAIIESWQQVLKSYVALIIYIAIFMILYLLVHLILFGLHPTGHRALIYKGLISLFILSIPFLLFAVVTFFTIPLIMTDDIGVFGAFKRSAELIGKKYWLIAFGLYIFLMAIFVIVDPYTRHGHFFASYHANIFFDLIVFCVTLPIFYNMLILLMNDLKLRRSLA